MKSQQKCSGRGEVYIKIRTLTLSPCLFHTFWRVKAVLFGRDCSGLRPSAVGYRLLVFLASAQNSWASLLPNCMNRSGLQPRNSGQEQLKLLERGGRSQAHHLGCLLRRKASV